ncbi:divalent-cation tolerance protein CutA [Candidatus Woesearchaeota archaeon]|nr:divalent-cation tolerance protein CutA [Candidatus Woesearchaeota archaeon]
MTFKDEEEATKIATHLIEKKLVACINMFPIKSIYRWQGKATKGKEAAIIAKTNDKNFKKMAYEVKKLHSYSVPCILKMDATANKDYESWAEKELA